MQLKIKASEHVRNTLPMVLYSPNDCHLVTLITDLQNLITYSIYGTGLVNTHLSGHQILHKQA